MSPLREDAAGKALLSVMTRTVEQARAIFPDAVEGDVGDLRLYWDPAKPNEVFLAKTAFETAQRLGVTFYRLRSANSAVGNVIQSWDDVERVIREAAEEAPPSESSGDAPLRRKRAGRAAGRQPVVIQGTPALGGG